MLGKWGLTEKGLAFFHAKPEYDGGWPSLLGLFGLAAILALVASIGGHLAGYLLSRLLTVGFNIIGEVSGHDVELIVAWIGFVLPKTLAATAAGIALVHVARLISKHSSDRFIDAIARTDWRQFWLGLAAFIVFDVFALTIIWEGMAWIWPDSPIFTEGQESASDWPFASAATLPYFLYVLILAPIVWLQTGAEELAFRGAWFQQFGALRGRWIIVVAITSFTFGLYHLGSAGIVMAAIGLDGLVWAYAVARFGNISYGWGAHFGNNFLLLAVLPLLPIESAEVGKMQFNQGPDTSSEGAVLLVSLFLAASLFMLVANIFFVQWLTRNAAMPKRQEPQVLE